MSLAGFGNILVSWWMVGDLFYSDVQFMIRPSFMLEDFLVMANLIISIVIILAFFSVGTLFDLVF